MSANQTSDLLRVGVLLSGEGTSLENLCERIDAGEVPARVVVVISSKEDAGGLRRAERQSTGRRRAWLREARPGRCVSAAS